MRLTRQYTLGELEARKQGIRAQLQAEGVFAANKQLTPPWDFNAVLVVAPLGGAGLGDFQAEADRLQALGICHFTYALSRFQGEGAPMEIRHALQAALGQETGIGATPFDAVVIIRGGGAVNDLAWLNDYGLARLICDLPIPVLTGIGHERDNTVLDEVAHTRYDTPSKVIAGIEQRIIQRVGEVKANFAQVANLAARASQAAREQASKFEMTVRLEALRHLAQGKQGASEHLAAIRMDAMQGVRSAAEQSRDGLQAVKTQVAAQLADARRDVPALWSQVAVGSAHALRTASTENAGLKDGILERARQQASHATQASRDALDSVSNSAKRLVRSAATDSQALLREITGQGPEKTLQRGFAIVRNQSGEPLTRVSQAMDGAAIEIEFQDGRVAATTQKHL
jgi:exodeoxyribonuclease VII large subunit